MTLLEKSIKHWERLVSGKRLKGGTPGSINCALCNKYLRQSFTCEGCPVKNKTGNSYCFDTPYDLIRSMLFTNEYLDSSDFKEAAKKELEFLKSLLPK